jgi:hypothetical protein
MGALTPDKRHLLEGLVEESLAAAGNGPKRALENLGGERAIVSAFGGPPLVDLVDSDPGDAECQVPTSGRGNTAASRRSAAAASRSFTERSMSSSAARSR